jgi:hypothetical protein
VNQLVSTKYGYVRLYAHNGQLVHQFGMETYLVPTRIEHNGIWFVPEEEELNEDYTSTWLYRQESVPGCPCVWCREES